MQYCSLQHWTLLPSPVIPTTGCCFCFGSVSSFFLELFLHWSPVAYWAPADLRSSSFSVIPFPSPVDHILATWCKKLTHLKRPWCWERLTAGGEGDDRGWDGWMASPTWWTWVWVNSGSWWWTGRPSVLKSMGSQGVRPDWATDLNCGSVITKTPARPGPASAQQCAGQPNTAASRSSPFQKRSAARHSPVALTFGKKLAHFC